MFPIRQVTVIVFVILLVLLALLIAGFSWAQGVFGLALALVLPGYAMTQALLPRQMMGVSERLVLSVGISIAVDVLGGVILNLTPWGLQWSTWAVLLIGISLFFAVIAVARKTWVLQNIAVPIRLGEGLLFGLAIVILVAALVMAHTPAPSQSIQGYTNLWMLPTDTNDQSTIRLGITSMELAAVDYSLEVKMGDQVISRSSLISLRPGDQWQETLELAAPQPASTRIEANLYRLDAPQSIYRQVILNK